MFSESSLLAYWFFVFLCFSNSSMVFGGILCFTKCSCVLRGFACFAMFIFGSWYFSLVLVDCLRFSLFPLVVVRVRFSCLPCFCFSVLQFMSDGPGTCSLAHGTGSALHGRCSIRSCVHWSSRLWPWSAQRWSGRGPCAWAWGLGGFDRAAQGMAVHGPSRGGFLVLP